MDACVRQEMGYSSIWGHTSHYLQAAPNYRVAYTLLQTLSRMLRLPLDLGELQKAAATFDQAVARAVENDEAGEFLCRSWRASTMRRRRTKSPTRMSWCATWSSSCEPNKAAAPRKKPPEANHELSITN